MGCLWGGGHWRKNIRTFLDVSVFSSRPCAYSRPSILTAISPCKHNSPMMKEHVAIQTIQYIPITSVHISLMPVFND